MHYRDRGGSLETRIAIHPHALLRLAERGCTEVEAIETVRTGESFPAKFGRNFAYNGLWRSRRYATKQVEAIAVPENGWLVITVIVKFF